MFELVSDRQMSENDRLWLLVLAARESRKKAQRVEAAAIDAWQRHIQMMIIKSKEVLSCQASTCETQ